MRLTLAVLLLLTGTAWGKSGPGGGGRVVRLSLAAGAAPDHELERFLREDLAWVARTPAEKPGLATAALAPTRTLSARLRDRWLARGYLAADCLPDSGADGATGAGGGAILVIAPGPRFHVGEVTVGGPDFAGRARALAAALPPRGAWFDPDVWEEAVARLLAAAGEAGHPFARWVIGEVRVDAARAAVDLTATLFTGPRAWLGPITSDLPGGRGAGFLRRASGLSPGAPYRESDLARARERLLERGVWLEVGEPLVHTANAVDTVGVHWPVVPVPRPNRFTAVIGLSRRDEGSAGATAAAGGSRLSGQVDLLLPDLAGTGRRLALAWTDDGRDRSRLGFSYLEPLAFGTPLDLEGSLAHEVEAQSYTRFSTDLRARLAVAGAWGLEFGLGRDRGTYPSGAWTSTRRLRARAALLRRRGDPGRSGWAGQFGLETARRQAVARVDTAAGAPVSPAGGTEARQSLLDLTWTGEAFLTATLSVAARGTFAEVQGDGGPIPLAEQYRFGGARTLRGYREGTFRGERVAHGSLEIRIGRPYRSRLYTFFDLGYFRFAAAAATAEDPGRTVIREGTPRGFGLGLETRAGGGDVSLAIGLPGRWNFDAALLHVSLLQAF
jgi:outer membrane protein assembly factor BamA